MVGRTEYWRTGVLSVEQEVEAAAQAERGRVLCESEEEQGRPDQLQCCKPRFVTPFTSLIYGRDLTECSARFLRREDSERPGVQAMAQGPACVQPQEVCQPDIKMPLQPSSSRKEASLIHLYYGLAQLWKGGPPLFVATRRLHRYMYCTLTRVTSPCQ